MVKYNIDRTFAALADPTRRAILAQLATGEASVSELAEPFEMSLPAVSKHLKILEQEPTPLNDVSEWIARQRAFWEGSLDSLARYLAVDAQAGDIRDD